MGLSRSFTARRAFLFHSPQCNTDWTSADGCEGTGSSIITSSSRRRTSCRWMTGSSFLFLFLLSSRPSSPRTLAPLLTPLSAHLPPLSFFAGSSPPKRTPSDSVSLPPPPSALPLRLSGPTPSLRSRPSQTVSPKQNTAQARRFRNGGGWCRRRR
jgi:hypothetical protein